MGAEIERLPAIAEVARLLAKNGELALLLAAERGELRNLRAEVALQRAKLKEKGLAFNQTLLMQGAELTELRAEVARLRGPGWENYIVPNKEV